MGAQAAAENDLFLQGHWGKEDAAGPARKFWHFVSKGPWNFRPIKKEKERQKERLKGHGPEHTQSELRSCAKVEVAVLGSRRY